MAVRPQNQLLSPAFIDGRGHVKALHDNGKGLSIRAISQELGLSRNTVRKYLRMEVDAITEQFADPSRSKRLDDHRDYLVHLLKQFPKLSAVKIARKLQAKVGDLPDLHPTF